MLTRRKCLMFSALVQGNYPLMPKLSSVTLCEDLLYLSQPYLRNLLMSLFLGLFIINEDFVYFSIDHEYIIVFN